MGWLSGWRKGPIATLALAWLVCSGAVLTIYFVAQLRSAERSFAEMGLRLGPGAGLLRVNWLDALPQLLAAYVIFVIVPPVLLWLLWRRARRAADSR
jgi:hypothetical protein